MTKTCANCRNEFRCKPSHFPLKTYCSKACMAEDYRQRLAGPQNPNYRDAGKHECLTCRKTFKRYNKASLYCSWVCRPVTTRNLGALAKDKIHDAVIAALDANGSSAIDTWNIGCGMPDLITSHVITGRPVLLEIKAPGMKLNACQRKWHAEWQGEAPVVVTSVEEALAAVGVACARLSATG